MPYNSIDELRAGAPEHLKDASDTALLDGYAKASGMDIQDVAETLGIATGKTASAGGAGLKEGGYNLKSTLTSAVAAGADVVGAKDFRDRMNRSADEDDANARLVGRHDLNNIEDVWDKPSKWAPYAVNQVAKQVPNIAGVIGSSLLVPEAAVPAWLAKGGAYAARLAGVGEAGAVKAGLGFGKQVLGNAAPNYAQGVGSVYNESANAGHPDEGGRALAWGVPHAAFETVPEAMLGLRLGHGAFAGGLGKRLLKAGGTQAVSGAASELGQNEIESYVNGGYSPEQMASRRLNAGVAGGLVEGLMGAAGGIQSRHAAVQSLPVAPAANDTEADLLESPQQAQARVDAQASPEAAARDPREHYGWDSQRGAAAPLEKGSAPYQRDINTDGLSLLDENAASDPTPPAPVQQAEHDTGDLSLHPASPENDQRMQSQQDQRSAGIGARAQLDERYQREQQARAQSANSVSPKGQVLLGLVDQLAGEGHLDDAQHQEASVLVSQGKFAAAKKLVDVAVKDKSAADSMVEKAAKIAQKEVLGKPATEKPANALGGAAGAAAGQRTKPPGASGTPETGNATNPSSDQLATAAPGAQSAVAPGLYQRVPDNATVAGNVQPAGATTGAVRSGEQGGPAVPAVAEQAAPLAALHDDALIAHVENTSDEASYKSALDELYKRQLDMHKEHPAIDAYVDEQYGTKPGKMAFKTEWDAAERRVEESNREGKKGLRLGNAQSTASTTSPQTDAILRGLALPHEGQFRTAAAAGQASEGPVKTHQAQAIVNRILAKVPNAPHIEVARNPQAAGIEGPKGGTALGATLANGDIKVFTDAMASTKDVEQTVFHELFHRGLRAVLKGASYVHTMEAIQNQSPEVRALAEEWAASEEGQATKEHLTRMPGGLNAERQANYTALGTEEGLARLAEKLMADKAAGSKPMHKVVRVVATWLAGIADKIGMKGLAQSIRGMGYNEVEKFVADTVGRSGEAPAVNSAGTGIGPKFSTKAQVFPSITADNPALEKAGNYFKDFIKDKSRTGLAAMMFTRDLARMVEKTLPSAGAYVGIINERDAIKTQYEQRIAAVLHQYRGLSVNTGMGPGSVNAYLKESTQSGNWGYVPEHNKKAVADPAMAAKFDALHPDAQAVVKEVFALGDRTLAETKAAVLSTIASEYDFLIKEAQAEGNAQEVKTLTAQKIAGAKDYQSLMAVKAGTPYAPLKRFGNHVVVGLSKRAIDAEAKARQTGDWAEFRELQQDAAHYFVQFASTNEEAQAIARDNAGKYQHVAPFNKNDGSSSVYGGRDVLGAFHRLRSMAQESNDATRGMSTRALNKMLNDLHLSLLSDQSVRQSERSRKNIAGADDDMMRAFATQGRASAQFLAAMHKNGEVYDSLKAMKAETEARTPGRDVRSTYYNEFMKRHAMSLDYRPSPIADSITRTSSLWTLLTNPAYYLQNATQPYMMSLPVLAGKHGYFQSAAAMTKAYQELMPLLKGGLNEGTYDRLPADVRGAIRKMIERGHINITLDQDLNNWRSLEDGKYKLVGDVAARIGAVSQSVETVNRVVTAVAAYRLEMAKHGDAAKAENYTADIINDTHGDYTGFNAPRFLRTPTGRVLGQFRKFQMIQLSLMVKLANQAFKGASPEERAVGKKALMFTLTQNFAMGGTMALPGFSAIAWAIGAIFGKDDEPNDPELYLRRLIGDKGMADLLLLGLPKLAGVNLSGKLGMGQAASLLPYTDLSLTKDGYNKALLAASGPFLGGILPKAMTGLGEMGDGHYYKGLEQLAPSGFGQALHGFRIATEGETMKNGDRVISPEEIGTLDAAMTALGLPTNVITDKRFLQNARFEHDQLYKDMAHKILNQYADAYRKGDQAGRADARTEWDKLQEARARNGYSRLPVSTLMKAPSAQATRERGAIAGVETNKANKKFVLETSGL